MENKILQGKIDDVLTMLLEAVNKVVDIGSANLPILAQEVVRESVAKNIVKIASGVVVTIVYTLIVIFLYRNEHCFDCVSGIIIAVVMLFSTVAVAHNLYSIWEALIDLASVLAGPKLYVLKYLGSLLKK